MSDNKPIGFLNDPAGDKSSKRLESFIGLTMGVGIAITSFCLNVFAHIDISGFPLVAMVIAFLTYSASMQGISMAAESSLFGGGQPSLPAPIQNAVTTVETKIDGVVEGK